MEAEEGEILKYLFLSFKKKLLNLANPNSHKLLKMLYITMSVENS